MKVRVIVSGRNYDASGAIPQQLTLPEGATLDDALRALAELLPEGKRLPDSCLVALSGKHLGTLRSHQPHAMRDGEEIILIAPVAGG